jgi:hypothetical protein
LLKHQHGNAFKRSETDIRIGNQLKFPRIIAKWLVFGHVRVMSEEKQRQGSRKKSKKLKRERENYIGKNE